VFKDRLRLAFSLVAGSDTFALTSGSIERVSLEMHPYGFEAEVGFLVSSETETDELFAPFCADDPIQVTLSVATCILDGTDQQTVPLVVSGPVIERSLREETTDEIDGQPIMVRHYLVRFVDAAAALWRQHHPIELFVDTSMKEVIEQYKFAGMAISYDWVRLGEKLDVLSVAAGAEGPASFYDLLMWYLDRNGGLIERAADGGAYRIASSKSRPTEPQLLERECVGKVRVVNVEPPRHVTRVRNSFSEGATTTPVPNTLARAGVYRDPLVRTPIVEQVARRVQTEAGRLRSPDHEIELSFARCPEVLRAPGAFVSTGEGWSPKVLAAGRVYRVIELRLRAAIDADFQVEPEDEACAFDLELSQRLELASSPRPHLPSFVAPAYPIVVEGKVVSDGGGDDDRTWMALENEKDSTLRYRVQVPLWNKKILAPFAPGYAPGHFFFPAYKHERVLVSLAFDGAEIRGYLDWAANARTPQGIQGNRLALGYQDSNGTTLDHSYPETSPTLTVARTFGNDLQTIVVKEGTIFMEVKEDETTAALEPRYSVAIVVSAAQEKVSGEVEGAMAEVTGSFEETMGSTSAKLDGSIAAVDASVTAAQAKLVAKLEATESALAEMAGALTALTQELSAAVAEAQAALAALLA
jgi:hypothetical protein